MSDYSSGYNFGGAADSGSKKQEVMDKVRSELALANAQELINKINEKCYEKCVPKPGSSLSSGEQACLSKCMDRYMEAWNVVSRAYVSRIQRESANQQYGGNM
ncbi:Putative Mitochondrial protein-transportingATPase [Lichtheimia ramosa]|uniref:Mitochondrial import inner membrane translocase subunit n=1 Tax=Lichtheimia ramosa TaxID=688394 RepID=A0A077X1W7_9FUNG|nr:Putative Mitochondrial protein-transportingATPase [Lichtheimia ramosa]